MLVCHHAPLDDFKSSIEDRFGKSLSPRTRIAELLCEFEGEIRRIQCPISIDRPIQCLYREMPAHLLIEGALKCRQITAGEAQTRGHRMATKLSHETGMPGRHRIEHITDMHPRHRACRSFDLLFLVAFRKGNDRPVYTLADARSQDADHALMPAFIEQAHPKGEILVVFQGERLKDSERL